MRLELRWRTHTRGQVFSMTSFCLFSISPFSFAWLLLVVTCSLGVYWYTSEQLGSMQKVLTSAPFTSKQWHGLSLHVAVLICKTRTGKALQFLPAPRSSINSVKSHWVLGVW